MSAEFIFPLRVASKISQSGRRSLLGTNKVTALNCKYVFPLLDSLWDFTHTQRARTHTHAQEAVSQTRTRHSQNLKPCRRLRCFFYLILRFDVQNMWVLEFGVGVRRPFNKTVFVCWILAFTS